MKENQLLNGFKKAKVCWQKKIKTTCRMIIKRNETGIKHTPCYMQYGEVPTLQQYGYCWSGKRHCVEVVRSIAYNGYWYDQWRITSTKLSKYDTE